MKAHVFVRCRQRTLSESVGSIPSLVDRCQRIIKVKPAIHSCQHGNQQHSSHPLPHPPPDRIDILSDALEPAPPTSPLIFQKVFHVCKSPLPNANSSIIDALVYDVHQSNCSREGFPSAQTASTASFLHPFSQTSWMKLYLTCTSLPSSSQVPDEVVTSECP